MPAQPDLDSWPALLGALEASLTAREGTVFDGSPPPAALILPPAPGALPPAYAARARAVLEALDAQEEQLAGELARVRLELARVTRSESNGPRPAAEIRAGGFEARA